MQAWNQWPAPAPVPVAPAYPGPVPPASGAPGAPPPAYPPQPYQWPYAPPAAPVPAPGPAAAPAPYPPGAQWPQQGQWDPSAWQQQWQQYTQWQQQYGATQGQQPPPQGAQPPQAPPPLPGDTTKRPAEDISSSQPAKKTKTEPESGKTGKSAALLKESLAELAEAEKQFDEQFKSWEGQFNSWRDQNQNHPDKVQYKAYEEKWESWREQLLQRREAMKKKKDKLEEALKETQKEEEKKKEEAQKSIAQQVYQTAATYGSGAPGGVPPVPAVSQPATMVPPPNYGYGYPYQPPVSAAPQPVPMPTGAPFQFPGAAGANNFLPVSTPATTGGIPGLDLLSQPPGQAASQVSHIPDLSLSTSQPIQTPADSKPFDFPVKPQPAQTVTTPAQYGVAPTPSVGGYMPPMGPGMPGFGMSVPPPGYPMQDHSRKKEPVKKSTVISIPKPVLEERINSGKHANNRNIATGMGDWEVIKQEPDDFSQPPPDMGHPGDDFNARTPAQVEQGVGYQRPEPMIQTQLNGAPGLPQDNFPSNFQVNVTPGFPQENVPNHFQPNLTLHPNPSQPSAVCEVNNVQAQTNNNFSQPNVQNDFVPQSYGIPQTNNFPQFNPGPKAKISLQPVGSQTNSSVHSCSVPQPVPSPKPLVSPRPQPSPAPQASPVGLPVPSPSNQTNIIQNSDTPSVSQQPMACSMIPNLQNTSQLSVKQNMSGQAECPNTNMPVQQCFENTINPQPAIQQCNYFQSDPLPEQFQTGGMSIQGQHLQSSPFVDSQLPLGLTCNAQQYQIPLGQTMYDPEQVMYESQMVQPNMCNGTEFIPNGVEVSNLCSGQFIQSDMCLINQSGFIVDCNGQQLIPNDMNPSQQFCNTNLQTGMNNDVFIQSDQPCFQEVQCGPVQFENSFDQNISGGCDQNNFKLNNNQFGSEQMMVQYPNPRDFNPYDQNDPDPFLSMSMREDPPLIPQVVIDYQHMPCVVGAPHTIEPGSFVDYKHGAVSLADKDREELLKNEPWVMNQRIVGGPGPAFDSHMNSSADRWNGPPNRGPNFGPPGPWQMDRGGPDIKEEGRPGPGRGGRDDARGPRDFNKDRDFKDRDFQDRDFRDRDQKDRRDSRSRDFRDNRDDRRGPRGPDRPDRSERSNDRKDESRWGPPESKPVIEEVKNQVVIPVEELLNLPARIKRPLKLVIILRGPPGSGKTHVAKLIKDREIEMGGSAPRILSLDDYFVTEVDRECTDESGKTTTKKVMEYEFDPSLEPSYRDSLVKAFKKTINDGYFNFVIVDCVNDKVNHFQEMAEFAEMKGFKVFVCEMDMDVNLCFKRNVHNRSEKEIQDVVNNFENTPPKFNGVNVRSLLKEDAIAEVDMEDTSDSGAIKQEDGAQLNENGVEQEEGVSEGPGANEEDHADEIEPSRDNANDEDEGADPESSSNFTSKWDNMDSSFGTLDRLDGLEKARRSISIKDWLQLPEDDPYEAITSSPTISSSKKRVRWADLEERRKQKKMKTLGFVVGHNNWAEIDETTGSDKLIKTKYI